MPTPPAGSAGPSTDPRLKVAGVVVVLAAVYSLIQHTSLAPFPHAADDFVAGLALGLALGSALVWFRSGR